MFPKHPVGPGFTSGGWYIALFVCSGCHAFPPASPLPRVITGVGPIRTSAAQRGQTAPPYQGKPATQQLHIAAPRTGWAVGTDSATAQTAYLVEPMQNSNTSWHCIPSGATLMRSLSWVTRHCPPSPSPIPPPPASTSAPRRCINSVTSSPVT